MRSELYEIKAAGLPGKNPFVERAETRAIVETVRDDISNIRVAAGSPPDQLDPLFLTSTDSRVQLVGIINRMDRQFHASQRESACGEISLIYRFAYSLSRLPVTMNLVFPAAVGTLHCKESAQRWLDAMSKERTMKPAAFAAYLVSKSGPLAHIAEACPFPEVESVDHPAEGAVTRRLQLQFLAELLVRLDRIDLEGCGGIVGEGVVENPVEVAAPVGSDADQIGCAQFLPYVKGPPTASLPSADLRCRSHHGDW